MGILLKQEQWDNKRELIGGTLSSNRREKLFSALSSAWKKLND